MNAIFLRAVLLFCLLTTGWSVQAQRDVPQLRSQVTDVSGILDASQKERLVNKLAALEAETGSQLAVLMVPTTAPEDIAAYALRVVEAWQLGRKGIDDGVLLLVATEDKRIRIEVGYGLEGAIPDARAKRIIDTIITPHFRSQDYATGVAAGADAIAQLIRGEELPDLAQNTDSLARFAQLEGLLPILLILVFVGSGILKSIMGSLPGAATTSAVAGLIVWLAVGAIGATFVVALIVFFVSLFMGGGGGGSWSSGGSGGGGFGRGGSFGGGGFGGGGGGFGGGGASGGW